MAWGKARAKHCPPACARLALLHVRSKIPDLRRRRLARRQRRAPHGAARRARTPRISMAFSLPRADAHQNEYVPKYAERLAWLTGFTGSAGFAVVLEKGGRALRRRPLCHSGAAARSTRSSSSRSTSPKRRPRAWLAEHAREGARIGYDPWVHTSGADRAFRQGARGKEDRTRSARRQSDRRAVDRSARRADGRDCRFIRRATPARRRREDQEAARSAERRGRGA